MRKGVGGNRLLRGVVPADTILRHAVDGDWPLARSLFLEATRVSHPGLGEPERLAYVEERRSRWMGAPVRVVAETEGGEATALVWVVDDAFVQGADYVQLIAVDPAHRRHGLARALLRYAVLRARERRRGLIRAGVHRDNAASLRLFASERFVPEEGHDGDFVLLRRRP